MRSGLKSHLTLVRVARANPGRLVRVKQTLLGARNGAEC